MSKTARISPIDAHDVRFPTSANLDRPDAMNPDPDYSMTYVVVKTDADDGLEGHGLTFAIGRGNELCVAAVQALARLLVEEPVESLLDDMGAPGGG